MGLTNDVIAALALALVGPAVLFVTALFIHRVPPPESEPARTAERIVRWYAAHPQLALWVPLPVAALGFHPWHRGVAADVGRHSPAPVLRVARLGGNSGTLAGRVHRRGDPPVGGRAGDDHGASHGRAGSWPSVRVALTVFAATSTSSQSRRDWRSTGPAWTGTRTQCQYGDHVQSAGDEDSG